MKRFTAIVTASFVMTAFVATTHAQTTLYWDITDGSPGFVTPGGFGDGTWDNATTANWNPNSDGSGANVTWDDAASPANNAVINVAGASGTNGSGWVTEDAGISVTGTRTTNTVTIGDSGGAFQWVVIVGGGTISAPNGLTVLNNALLSLMPTASFSSGGGVIDTGTNNLTINAGGQVDIGGTNVGSVRLNSAGKVVLNGGTLYERNTGNAGSFIAQAKNLEVNGTGMIGYDDGNGTPDNQVSILNGNIILGTGGDPLTGGAGTLIKTGPDQIGFAYRADTGGGVSNAAQNSFAKLKVVQGGFRLRNTGGVIDERLFGAVPLTELADAITLDGGGIGSNQTVTLDAKRGITIASTGYFDSGATAGLIIPGPITAAPGTTLIVGDPTTTSASAPNFTLSNANNTTTFQGNVLMKQGTLQLGTNTPTPQVSNLTTPNFSGTGQNGAVGIVAIADNTTLTVGSDNADTSFDGRITNATGGVTGGIFTKVGSGTLTLNPPTTEWSNTGGVNINAGTIKYGTSAAGFSNAATVSIGATGKLNMNGINDSFGALSGPAGATVDMKDTAATPGNLTLAAASPVNTTYSGTITGGGNLTKSSSSTQVLAGNTSLGTVAVNGGKLINNATMTTSGGVTVGASGTLGGTGTIIGAVANNGTIAPGASVGTLNVTGNVTDGADSHWAIELSGTSADKLAVTGSIDLLALDSLDVTGTGTGTSWLIGTYTGTLMGTFDNVTTGYTVDYTGGNITLNAAAGVAGDYNNDGKVDARDYVLWRKSNINGSQGYTDWRTNFGIGTPGAGSGSALGGAAAVPEPSSLVFAIVGLVLAVAAGRRR